ncbi:MAG TPA: ScyD/ScyE family protein [Dermatophilaceae bacterium]|nr:ScyD/ScyE family protein [Dermatophilaceae bacterium]
MSVGVALAMGLSLAAPATAGDRNWDDGSWDDESWQDSRHGGSWEDKDPPEAKTLVSGLGAPALGLAVGSRGTFYVTHGFPGILSKVDRKGTRTDIVPFEADGFSGVDVGQRDRVTYLTGGWVKRLKANGQSRVLNNVSLADFEASANPDQVNSYGFQGLSEDCKAQFPVPPPTPDAPTGDSYPGAVDSNPYAVAVLPHGGVVVADAGGNTLVRVSRSGEVSTLAVLPPRPVTVTAEIAAGVGVPTCTVGFDYNFDPVPTDVEVGPDGMLYVSLLPGGPEDGSLGARGSVFRVNPWNGKVKEIATGFLGAVDLAVDDDGTVYVAELFGNAITKVGRHGNRKVVDVDAPGAVEYANGTLYVTVGNGFPNFGDPTAASVVKIKV